MKYRIKLRPRLRLAYLQARRRNLLWIIPSWETIAIGPIPMISSLCARMSADAAAR